MRLYHPELDRVWEGPDDDNLAAVMARSGWGKTIPPEHNNPALADDQPEAVYQLVNPDDTDAGSGKKTDPGKKPGPAKPS